MSAPIRSRSPLHPYWHGVLCHETFDDVIEHLTSMIRNREYAFVATCEDVIWPTDVRVGQRLTGEPRITKDEEVWSATYTDGNYVWGLHTWAATRQEAWADGPENSRRVLVSFKRDSGGEKCEIQQRNGYDKWLHWTVAVASR